ncbi:MAG: MMPL family transporter [Deltaproteobacteria bacterium]|nr:MMPL family transporter [Deltaproteobacteria bacterium]
MRYRDRIDQSLEHWGRLMVRHHWSVLTLALVFLVWMASLLPMMRVENDGQSFLNSNDSASMLYDTFCDQFGQDEQILIAITPPDVFAPRFLEMLRDLHAALEDELPHVTEVNSLINARNTRGEDDMLVVEDLMAEWPTTPEAFVALRARVFANPLYLDNLISRNGRTTTITIEPDLYSTADDESLLGDLAAGFDSDEILESASGPEHLSSEEKREILTALDEILARYQRPDVEVRIAGAPVMVDRINLMMNADVRAYMSMSGLAIALFLFGLFRRLSGVLLPALIVAASLISTLGTMVLIDIPFSLTLGMVPIITMTVGVCTTIHVLVVVYREVKSGRSREDAIASALRHSGLAICMASATTAAGMLSFMTAEVEPIRHLGIVVPFAVGYAFAFTMILLPALISLIPLRADVWAGKRAAVPVSERLLVWIGIAAVRHSRLVLVSALVLLVVLLVGATRLRFSHEPVSWFPEGDRTRVAIETVDRVLRGSSNLELMIDTGRENGLHEPEVLRRIEAAMVMAEGLRVGPIFVGKALSLVDIVKESHQALSGGDPESRVIPDSRPVIAQELLLFENGGGDDLEKFVDSQFRIARLSLRLPESDAVGYRQFLTELGSGLDETLGDELEYQMTGRTMLAARAMSALITSMGTSYLVALLVITPIMILFMGDLRLGLISMVPNLFPVIFVLGIMGWMDLPLDASNAVIGCIIIGLAVDDTIHFLQCFRRDFGETGQLEEAVRRTMRVTGSALLFTSLVLSTGFLVMALRGTMLNTINFGALSASGIAFAFLADVIVTPALIAESKGLLVQNRPQSS